MAGRAWTDGEVLAAWSALPAVLSGESWRAYNRIRAYARKYGIALPRRRAARPPGARRGDLGHDEWLARWESLPVPIALGDAGSEYQALRRMALRLGYPIPRRPNPGQDRLRGLCGRMADSDW